MWQWFSNIQRHSQSSAFASTSFEETGSSTVAVMYQAVPMSNHTAWS